MTTYFEPSPRFAELSQRRELARTLMGGSVAMRKAGVKYLPQHAAETPETYAARLMCTTLYNAFKDAVLKQAGKLFAEPIILTETVPEQLLELTDDIDGMGRAITPFAMDVVMNAMCDGVSFILVDYPNLTPSAVEAATEAEDAAAGAAAPRPVTYADQKALGARPYWICVLADDLLRIKTSMANGHMTLTEARIRERVPREDDKGKEYLAERVRVLRPGAFEVYEQQKVDGKVIEVLVEEGTSTLDEICLVPVYTNRVGYFEGEPPLQPLAELNQDHWISSSEQRHALTFLRFAMLAISGVRKDDMTGVVIGPDQLLALPTGADAKYLEHSGKGIESGFNDLDRIEKRMQTAGMTLRLENAGQVTATAAAIDSGEANAALKAVAAGLKDSLEQALDLTATMLGINGNIGGDVEVYDEFGGEEIAGTPDDLNKLRATGSLSLETLWEELERRHVLSDDFDPDEEKKRLAAGRPTPTGPPPQPGQFGPRPGGSGAMMTPPGNGNGNGGAMMTPPGNGAAE